MHDTLTFGRRHIEALLFTVNLSLVKKCTYSSTSCNSIRDHDLLYVVQGAVEGRALFLGHGSHYVTHSVTRTSKAMQRKKNTEEKAAASAESSGASGKRQSSRTIVVSKAMRVVSSEARS